VSLLATNHPLLAQERLGLDENGNATTFAEYAEEIHIEDNVWLAAGVSVLGGVRIGKNAVIGAGSVVSSDIPANTLAVGIPCRPIRTLTEKDSCRDRFLEEDKAYYKYNLK
jgi:acetyltransferase-like isoleucine patch superfamily enzyme